MAKISKTQAEAAYNVLRRKIVNLRASQKEGIIAGFSERYPEVYEKIQEYFNLLTKALQLKEDIRREFKCNVYGVSSGYTIENTISNFVDSEINKIFPIPNSDEFIDELIIKGETDIADYIEEYFNKIITKNA